MMATWEVPNASYPWPRLANRQLYPGLWIVNGAKCGKPEKTRKFLLMNGMGILSIYWVFDQGAFYACLPPKPTLPRLREDGTLPQEVLETLSNYQLEEYKNLSSPYSFFPNRYRVC